jgi:hypothetical protein
MDILDRSIAKSESNDSLGFPGELPVVEIRVHLELSSIAAMPVNG